MSSTATTASIFVVCPLFLPFVLFFSFPFLPWLFFSFHAVSMLSFLFVYLQCVVQWGQCLTHVTQMLYCNIKSTRGSHTILRIHQHWHLLFFFSQTRKIDIFQITRQSQAHTNTDCPASKLSLIEQCTWTESNMGKRIQHCLLDQRRKKQFASAAKGQHTLKKVAITIKGNVTPLCKTRRAQTVD